jgi:tape measure domain-containing protein
MADTKIVITAEDQASATLSRIERKLEDIDRTAELASRAFAGLIGALSVQAIVRFSDEVTSLNNKLANVTNSSEEFAAANRAVFDIARKTSAPVAEVATMFQKLSIAQDSVGLTGAGVAKVTELITKQMKAVGVSGASAASYMLQLSQAFGSGRLQGDEFRSIMEANPALLKLVAKEMGVTTGALKQLGSEGKITGVILRDTFINNMAEIEASFGKRTRSISDGLEEIKTSAMKLWQEFDRATGFSSGLSKALSFVAENLDRVIVVLGTFFAVLAVQHILAAGTAMTALGHAIEFVNAAIAKNFVAILIAGLVLIGYEIYKSVIKPLVDAGVGAKDIALYIADNLINAFIQVGRAVGNIFGAIPDIIVAALTPGAKVSDALAKLNKAIEKSLTERKVKLISDADFARFKEIEQATNKITTPSGPLTKKPQATPPDAETTKARENALKALDSEIRKMQIAAGYERDRLTMSEHEAGLKKLLAEEADKLAKVGVRLTDGQRQRLTAAYQELGVAKSQGDITRLLADSSLRVAQATELDLAKRQIIAPLAQITAKYGKQAADAAYEELFAKAKKEIAQTNLARLEAEGLQIAAQTISLGTKDLDQRAIVLAIERERARLKSSFNEEQEEEIRNLVKAQQENAKLIEMEKLRAQLTGQAAPSTQVQRLAGAQGVIGQLDPRIALDQDYANKKASLEQAMLDATLSKDQKLLAARGSIMQAQQALDLQYIRNKEVLEEQYRNSALVKEQAHQEQMYQARLKNAQAEQLLRVQQQTGTQFGYETQKQMADEAAKFQMKSDKEKYAFGLDQASQMFNSLGTYNKKAFEAAKAFNIANAVMNTYMGATKALATYPPPFNFIAAAAVVAMGLAQVASIRSQQYSGRALGGPVMGGQTYMVGENGPELFTPATSGGITRNDQLGGGGEMNVNFTIIANDTAGFDQLLTSRRGLITQILADAQLERGRRA